MEELLFAVDEDPTFVGAKSIYEAKLWDIVQASSISPLFIRAEVDQLLTENKLTRVRYGMSPSLEALRNQHSDKRLFIKCLQLTLKHMEGFSASTLLWWLYLEAKMAKNWEILQLIESIADAYFDSFFRAYFPEPVARDYYVEAFKALVDTKIDHSDFVEIYGILELTSCVIIPNHLLDKISEEDLFKEVTLKTGIKVFF